MFLAVHLEEEQSKTGDAISAILVEREPGIAFIRHLMRLLMFSTETTPR
jgi:hypothetical protein